MLVINSFADYFILQFYTEYRKIPHYMRDQSVCINRGSSAPVSYKKDPVDVQIGRTGGLHSEYNSATQYLEQFRHLSHGMHH